LTDRDYQVYPAEAHRLLSGFLLSEYRGDWQNCQDPYALAYTASHLTEAVQRAEHRRTREEVAGYLIALLTDWGFLEAKTLAGSVFDLARDLARALEVVPFAHPERHLVFLLDKAIRADVYFIARHPALLFQCLWNRGWWYDCPQVAAHYDHTLGAPQPAWQQPGPKLYRLLEAWKAGKEKRQPHFRWLRALRPPPEY